VNAPRDAYPLTWPLGRPRTPAGARTRAKFGRRRQSAHGNWTVRDALTIPQALERVREELRLFGAEQVVISTNVELRIDGLPRGDRRDPTDPGVAVYFRLNNQPRVISCDGWDRVADNLAAIAATIDAKRGEMRWKTGTADQAFAGYAALPPLEPKKPWFEILGFKEGQALPADVIESRRRSLLLQHHPDRGGSASLAAEINAAADEGIQATEARP
jgi:hypothetical protein